MRYLKYFESAREYYSQISNEEGKKYKFYYTSNYRVNFTNKEVKSVEKLDCVSNSYKFINSDNHFLLIVSKGTYTSVYKIEDEWYVIEYSSAKTDSRYIYYKCDQLEGLLKCLQDIL